MKSMAGMAFVCTALSLSIAQAGPTYVCESVRSNDVYTVTMKENGYITPEAEIKLNDQKLHALLHQKLDMLNPNLRNYIYCLSPSPMQKCSYADNPITIQLTFDLKAPKMTLVRTKLSTSASPIVCLDGQVK